MEGAAAFETCGVDAVKPTRTSRIRTMKGLINADFLRRSAAIVALWTISAGAQATIVEFQTAEGNFQVNLYDNATPETVANFLNYVNNGAYTSSIFHRSVPGFVIQGGGFTVNVAAGLDTIPVNAAVVNEPEFANVRGTIAMAKLAGDPNSATSQWFFNLADNTANLDGQNGGFTVFGEVVGNGMDVVDAIAALPVYDFGGVTAEIPLRNYTQADFDARTPVDENNFVMINAIVVTDTTVDSAAGLNPPANTASGGGSTPNPPPAALGGGGGSLGLFGVFGLIAMAWRRKRA
jgi:peptidyl-prolyl cis-trans isomerase A (cyclophilin A)